MAKEKSHKTIRRSPSTLSLAMDVQKLVPMAGAEILQM